MGRSIQAIITAYAQEIHPSFKKVYYLLVALVTFNISCLWTFQLFPISELTHLQKSTQRQLWCYLGNLDLLRKADRWPSLHSSWKPPFLPFLFLLITQERIPIAGIRAMATGDEQEPGDCNCVFVRTYQAWTRTHALSHSTTGSHIPRFYIWKLHLLPPHVGLVSNACYYKLQLRQHREQTRHEVLVSVFFLMVIYFVCVCLGKKMKWGHK